MEKRIDVYISPSVQEYNIGYGAFGTEEQRMNMIGDVLEYELDRHGLRLARNSPAQTLSEIVAESNAIRPRVHVALHTNAYNGLARGAEVYVHRLGGASEPFARGIYQYVSELTPTSDLGVKESADLFGGQGLYELRRTTAPATLVEYAFHDNPEDAQFVIDNVFELGRATAQGILQGFGIPYRPDTPENIAYLKYKFNGIPL